jgi:hypothetical protein
VSTNPNSGSSLSSGSLSRMSMPGTTESAISSGNSRETILGLLHIPTHLADRADRGLRVAYEKYKAHLEACQTYEKMIADGTWAGKKLTSVDLIELFVSKSYWHLHFKPTFSKVSNYPLMMEWLENDSEGSVSNLEVWGVEKASYNFKDLHAWLEQGKGKKKAKVTKVTKADGGGDKNKKKKDGGNKKGKMQV